jgi:sigma-B regulation protein RsbU (phosphoserine phosphatase)
MTPANNTTSEHVALQLSLQNCERRYEELLKAVTDYTYTVTIDNGMATKTAHSPACLGVTGFSSDEYAANSYLWFNMIHEEDRASVITQTAEVLAGKEFCVLEHRIYHKDGSIKWIKNTIVRPYNTQHQLIAYDGLICDITEKKTAEKKLEYAVREWSNTFDSISDFVSVHDKEFKFIRVNKSLAGFLGMKPEELVGRRCYELIHLSQDPWPLCPHAKALQSRKTVTEEIIDPKSGSILSITCSPYFDEQNNLLGTVHIARDISKQKQSEKEKEHLIAELQEALAQVKLLSGFLPICSSCKKIRDDKGYWKQIESYIRDHSEVEFSHSICPECAKKLYPEEYEAIYPSKK